MSTNVKETTLVTRTLDAQTQLEIMYVNAILDVLEMDVIVQVNSIDFLGINKSPKIIIV